MILDASSWGPWTRLPPLAQTGEQLMLHLISRLYVGISDIVALSGAVNE